jgi:hypothetical protein
VSRLAAQPSKHTAPIKLQNGPIRPSLSPITIPTIERLFVNVDITKSETVKFKHSKYVELSLNFLV